MCIHERISFKNKNNTIPLEPPINLNKTYEGVKENESSNWIFKKKLKDQKRLHYDEAALF